jgi:hypothetical protein
MIPQTQEEGTARSSQLGSNCIQLPVVINFERACKNKWANNIE